MQTDSIESLIKILSRLPGVGSRQARRFAYALTRQNSTLGNELTTILKNLKDQVFSCELCGATSVGTGNVCDVCSRENRDPRIVALVASQEDYDSLHNAENYRGMLAIVPFPVKIETAEHTGVIEQSYIPNTLKYWMNKGLEEIILAFPISPEGEIMESITIDYLDILAEKATTSAVFKKPTVTSLGRGMSLGARLSESDDETIRYSLQNRKRAI